VAGAAASELAEIDGELEARRAERDDRASAIEPDLLELYDDLRRQKKGVGAAGLVDGVCQGCHEQLSSVELDRLKRTDGIRRCEHCRRILVF
jgi:predicted  nucleic acid-binding Zn-ribbon protein